MQELDWLGLLKEGTGADARVVVALTRRCLALFDAEHIACKVYMFVHRTLGNRIINRTKGVYAHTHPVRRGLVEWPKVFHDIAKRAEAGDMPWDYLPATFWLKAEEAIEMDEMHRLEEGDDDLTQFQ